MCPHEVKTAPREGVALQIDRNNAINVPANTDAVFTVTMGNIGQAVNSGDQMTYKLGVVTGTNPKGAIIKVDGQNLLQPVSYVLNQGEALLTLIIAT
jgi:hypothetical protein